MTEKTDTPPGPPSEMEILKDKTNYLRGTIVASLNDPLTGAIADADTQLTKFHGTYQQDDRDCRLRRQHKKLEPAYSFMVRIGIPGGICTSAQWLAMDRLGTSYGNQTLKLTTRQAFQLHGVIKKNLWASIHAINEACMTTLAACGDVVRNTMATPNPCASQVHAEVDRIAREVASFTKPRTRAYHEIWVEDQQVLTTLDERPPDEVEPLYRKHYLPRKFKIGFAIPPQNDVDVYSQDLGFVAIEASGQLLGFNVTCGGGMGMTHGMPETYPRLGDTVGFCTPEQVLTLTEVIVGIQRDFGDRSNRKHARFKYTIDDRGVDWLKDEIAKRFGQALAPAREVAFEDNGDCFGWLKGIDQQWYLTLFVEHGRLRDTTDCQALTALRRIAELDCCDFRLTGNANVMLGNVSTANKKKIDALLKKHGLAERQAISGLRRHSMACASFPYCGLAMAESERYLPELVTKLEAILDTCGLRDEPILIRSTGCPNGCARPYLGEIALVGKALGQYNLYLGANHTGTRLNKLYRENIDEAQIIAELTPIFERFAKERQPGEHFGDFTIRAGYVKATINGTDFHA